MNIAVLASRKSWYLADLRRAAGDEHVIEAVSFSDLASVVDSDGAQVSCTGQSLNTLDAVLVRTMPPGSLEQIVFRMDALAQLEAAGVHVLNPAKAIETAVDKYLATARLCAAGLLVPRTIACQTTGEAMDAFERLGRDVVVKPLFGGEGRGITRVSDDALALRAFRLIEQLGGVIYVQEFIEHEGFDVRLLTIGQRVIGMRRVSAGDWRTNISRGAEAQPLGVTPELSGLARRAAAAVGAPLAGVDLLPARDGRLYAIEVNAVPGWRALAACTGEDVARGVLELLASTVRTS